MQRCNNKFMLAVVIILVMKTVFTHGFELNESTWMPLRLFTNWGLMALIWLFSKNALWMWRLLAKSWASILSIWLFASDTIERFVKGRRRNWCTFRMFSLLMNKLCKLMSPMKAFWSRTCMLFMRKIKVSKLMRPPKALAWMLAILFPCNTTVLKFLANTKAFGWILCKPPFVISMFCKLGNWMNSCWMMNSVSEFLIVKRITSLLTLPCKWFPTIITRSVSRSTRTFSRSQP